MPIPTKIPKNLQGTLWSKSVAKLDLQIDKKNYIIHQILAYGTWEQTRWLFRTYPKSEIIKTFISHPTKDYLPASFHFVKEILLKIPRRLNESLYVRSISRNLG